MSFGYSPVCLGGVCVQCAVGPELTEGNGDCLAGACLLKFTQNGRESGEAPSNVVLAVAVR
jgi:hypothetical protein